MKLQSLGWSAFFEAQWNNTLLRPCRIVSDSENVFLVDDGERETLATLRGHLRDQANFPPVTGDWALANSFDGERYVIEGILDRRTALVRKQAGKRVSAQILAANIDRVMLVTSMDQDFSVRRLERYLTLVWESGAVPVIVLTKADLVDDPAPFLREAEKCALGFPVVAISSVSGAGLDELRSLPAAGETIVLLGSSGVGKSTLVHALGGALRETADVREKDGKGRHTTTGRRLVRLPSGILLIDTPGLREVQLWVGEGSVDQTFPEIAELAANCRFRDCRHHGEPGCAVTEGVGSGQIDEGRLAGFHRLNRELSHLNQQSDPLSARGHKDRMKRIMRAQKQQRRHRQKP